MHTGTRHRTRAGALLLASLALPLADACAALEPVEPSSDDAPAADVPPDADTPLLDRDRITGNWFGARATLEDAGLTINAEYVAEYASVWSGGVSQTASFRNVFTLDAELDLETSLGLDGASVFVQYLSVSPESGGSRDAGDSQLYSNIESDKHLDVIYELWYQQRLFDDRLRIKAGKIEANAEFASVDVAGEFANSSAGFSPTILGFPSYPDPATGVALFATLADTGNAEVTLGYGFFDGALGVDGVPTGRQGPATFFSDDRSDDYFHILQGELTWEAIADEGAWWKDGRLSLAGWAHTGDFERFDAGTEDTSAGLYLTLEQRLFDSGRTDDAGVYAFAQYAWADEDVSAFAQHVGAGVVIRATFPGRDNDSAGVYFTYVDLSDAPGAGFDEDEFVVDAYYRIAITPAVFIQPEIQYIANPSGDADLDDAVVGGIRVGITF